MSNTVKIVHSDKTYEGILKRTGIFSSIVSYVDAPNLSYKVKNSKIKAVRDEQFICNTDLKLFVSKEYKKMIKTYKKQLKEICKESMPWSYGWLEKYIYTYLKWFKAYYENGENVHCAENSNKPTRLEIATELTNKYEDYADLEENRPADLSIIHDYSTALNEKYLDFFTSLGKKLQELSD